MNRYKLIYGGQAWIEAETEDDAYHQFHEQIRQRLATVGLGLIVEVQDEQGAPVPRLVAGAPDTPPTPTIRVIHPDGTEHTLRDPPRLPEMQTIVGGYVEFMTVLDRVEYGHPIYTLMVVNDNGRMLNLPENPKATEIYQRNARWQYPEAEFPWVEMDETLRELVPGVMISLKTSEDLINPRIRGTVILMEGYGGLEEVDQLLEDGG